MSLLCASKTFKPSSCFRKFKCSCWTAIFGPANLPSRTCALLANLLHIKSFFGKKDFNRSAKRQGVGMFSQISFLHVWPCFLWKLLQIIPTIFQFRILRDRMTLPLHTVLPRAALETGLFALLHVALLLLLALAVLGRNRCLGVRL